MTTEETPEQCLEWLLKVENSIKNARAKTMVHWSILDAMRLIRHQQAVIEFLTKAVEPYATYGTAAPFPKGDGITDDTEGMKNLIIIRSAYEKAISGKWLT